MYISICLKVCMCTRCVQYLQRPEEDIVSPETRVIDDCEPLVQCSKLLNGLSSPFALMSYTNLSHFTILRQENILYIYLFIYLCNFDFIYTCWAINSPLNTVTLKYCATNIAGFYFVQVKTSSLPVWSLLWSMDYLIKCCFIYSICGSIISLLIISP